MIKLVGGSVSAAGYVQMIKGASADGGPDIIQLQQCPYYVLVSKWCTNGQIFRNFLDFGFLANWSTRNKGSRNYSSKIKSQQ